MRILLASSSSGSRGGGELFLLYLAEGLVARRHDVSLWASSHPRMDELAERFRRLGEVVRAPYKNTYDRPGRSLSAYFDGRTAREVAAQWRGLAPDCIHLNKQNLEDGLDLLAALAHGPPSAICTIHLTQNASRLEARAAWLRDFVARRALLSTRVPLVTVVESRRRDLADFLRVQREIEMVRNGVPAADLAPLRAASRRDLGIAPDEFVIVGVGRLVEQKRPLLFLEVVEKIQRERQRTRAYWVGDGAFRENWDRDVTTRGLGAVAIRVGWQQNVAPFLAAADLFLHVADYEGLPLALLEAMAAGVPCAVSDNLRRDLPFLNAENSIGLSDSESWLSAVKDPQVLQRIGLAGRRLIEHDFSCAEMARRYEALYERHRRS